MSLVQLEVFEWKLAKGEHMRGQCGPASRVRALRVGGARIAVDARARLFRQTQTL